MEVTASFSPSGNNDVAVAVTGTSTSSGGWSFAAAFPTLAHSVLGDLVVLSGATLTLTTIPSDGSTGGLVFNGPVNVAAGLGQVAKLIGSVASLTFSGPITLSGGAPVFELRAPVAAPFSLGPLKDLGFTVVLQAVSVAQVVPTAGNGSLASMALETTVAVEIASGKVILPASLTFGGGGVVNLVITAPTASGVSIANLLPWGLGGNL
jgi:hypothetical protein